MQLMVLNQFDKYDFLEVSQLIPGHINIFSFKLAVYNICFL
jgi:hypothetical protein